MSSHKPTNTEAKKKFVKKSTAEEDGRRRREATMVKIRKDKREEGLQKRRMMAADIVASAEASSSSEAPAAAGSAGPSFAPGDIRLDLLESYCQAASSNEVSEQFMGVTCIRRLLSSESNPPVEAVINSGILPRLVELLLTEDARLAEETAWALTNVASTEYTAAVVEAGAIEPLVQCMMNADAKVREQAIWCCGNIAGDCPKFRDHLLNCPGAVDALLRNVEFAETASLLRNTTWTISNLCRGKPSPAEGAVRYMLPAIVHLLNHSDKDVVQDAAWALSYLTDGDDAVVEAVVESEITRRCVELMSHEEPSVIMPALRTVGNLISGKDVYTQAALDAGALKNVVPLLSHTKRNIRREACWAVSNVAAGTGAQIDALMAQPGLVMNVITQLRVGEWNVKKEASWVISNIAASGSIPHVQALVAMGVVEPVADLLKSQDVRVLCVVLDTVTAMMVVGAKLGGSSNAIADLFEEAGMLDTLEDLQNFGNDDVYHKCVDLIEKYYGSEEANDDNAAPQQAAATGSMSMTVPSKPFGGAATFTFGGAASGASAFGGFSSSAANGAMPWAGSFNTPPTHGMAAGGQGQGQTLTAAPAFNFGAVRFV